MQQSIKEWLMQAKSIDKLIEAKLDELHRVETLACKITSILSKTKVQSSHINTNEDLFINYVDVKNQIMLEIKEYTKLENDIRTVIKNVKNLRLRQLLIRYYENNETWEQIAEAMELSEKWVRGGLHGQALIMAERVRDRLSL